MSTMPNQQTAIKQSRALTAAAIRLETGGEWWSAAAAKPLRRRREALAILTQKSLQMLGDNHWVCRKRR